MEPSDEIKNNNNEIGVNWCEYKEEEDEWRAGKIDEITIDEFLIYIENIDISSLLTLQTAKDYVLHNVCTQYTLYRYCTLDNTYPPSYLLGNRQVNSLARNNKCFVTKLRIRGA